MLAADTAFSIRKWQRIDRQASSLSLIVDTRFILVEVPQDRTVSYTRRYGFDWMQDIQLTVPTFFEEERSVPDTYTQSSMCVIRILVNETMS